MGAVTSKPNCFLICCSVFIISRGVQAISLAPDAAHLYLVRGAFLAAQRRHPESFADLAIALQLEPHIN